MKKNLLILAITLLGALTTHAQESYPTVVSAEEAFARREYQRAARLYEKVLTFHHQPANAESRLAECYLQQNEWSKAAKLYDRITSEHPMDGEYWINYGDALKGMGRYDEAKAAYRQAPDSLQKRFSMKIAGCDSAVWWMAHPVSYTVTNLVALNSSGSDWGAQWYGGRSIVFTSDSLRTRILGKARRLERQVFRRTGRPFQKIYVADSSDKGVGPVKGFSAVMNSNAYHDGPVSFTARGDTAYFTVTNPEMLDQPGDTIYYGPGKKQKKWGIRRLEIFWVARDSSGNWGQPHSLMSDNTGKYSVGHATLSLDGRTLYFTSNMPGGFGKTDIWYVERQSDGSWSAPENCGPSINTEENEAFANMGVDSRLYFASKGLAGMGGYDIFAATGEKSVWTSVRNLGYPINSAGDDFYFTTRDSLSGFLSSDRPGGLGSDDIYKYVYVPGKGAPLTAGGHGAMLNGVGNGGDLTRVATVNPILRTRITDSLTGQPLQDATVVVTQTRSGQRYTTITGGDGSFTQPVEHGTPYTDSVYKKGYTPGGASFTGKDQDTLNVKICLQKNPELGDIFVLRSLYYDFNKAGIRPDAAGVLDGLVGYMKQFPGVTIDLSAFTDSRGSDTYNLDLSRRRAESARKYLLDHGIAPDRVMAHGFGETKLVNGCSNGVPCTDAQHQANRRTEVRVLHQ
ncbi:MAG TPA: OmpA family protein [Dinghuibacter sp.]|jgi:outer membrane protein OmpA-like peptidoglycan-associated protein|uniref:OmpA family protein n=1 Tax=Dinghuibacter sp. TaxID=2024697 RepID=UPI002CED9238|nr:OmpA family protein [Dinghuibacter sp.]HTJ12674.1 OmpA family protein [Dinghuibacter sp.]